MSIIYGKTRPLTSQPTSSPHLPWIPIRRSFPNVAYQDDRSSNSRLVPMLPYFSTANDTFSRRSTFAPSSLPLSPSPQHIPTRNSSQAAISSAASSATPATFSPASPPLLVPPVISSSSPHTSPSSSLPSSPDYHHINPPSLPSVHAFRLDTLESVDPSDDPCPLSLHDLMIPRGEPEFQGHSYPFSLRSVCPSNPKPQSFSDEKLPHDGSALPKRKGNSKMHTCSLCQKFFPRPSGLRTHMNSHSRDKLYKCPVTSCAKPFTVSSNAKRHNRTHGVHLAPEVEVASIFEADSLLVPTDEDHQRALCIRWVGQNQEECPEDHSSGQPSKLQGSACIRDIAHDSNVDDDNFRTRRLEDGYNWGTYRDSGDHGEIGLHECWQQSKSASVNFLADSAIPSSSSSSPSKSTVSRPLHNLQGFDQSTSQEHVPASPTDRRGELLSDHVWRLSTDDPQRVDPIGKPPSPTPEHIPTSVTLIPVLVSPDGLAFDRSDPTRKLLVNDQQYVTTLPSQEHIPASPHSPPDKLLSDYVRESPADDEQRIDATHILSFSQDCIPLSPAQTLPDNLTSDLIPELLADDQKDITAITWSSITQGYTQVHASSHGSPDNPLSASDHMHELSTDDRQCINATNTPSCSTQSSPLSIPTPPDKFRQTLSCWIKNMHKLSSLVDRLQELASSASPQHRSKLLGQVATLRAILKKQQENCVEFLQLSEEYANRYLLDIFAEIQRQSDFLDKLEERLEAATKLRGEAVELKMFYESGTVATMKNLRATALSRPLPEDQALFDEVDLVLTEIRRCYAELDKFWTDEISRAFEAYRTRRVDPTDFERWKNFRANLKQTVESWKDELPSADAQTLHGSNSCEEADIGAIASSLSSAVGLLTSALDRLPSSNSFKYLRSGRSFIQRVYVAFAANSDLCLSFIQRCANYGEKVFACCPPSISSPASSHVGAPRHLRDRTMRLLSEMKTVSTENAVRVQGSRKFKVAYRNALRLEQKTSSGLNTLLEAFSSWVPVTPDGHGLPDNLLSDAIPLEELRELWEKARYSMSATLAVLRDEPAPQLCYRSATLASTQAPPLSVMKRLLMNYVCFS